MRVDALMLQRRVRLLRSFPLLEPLGAGELARLAEVSVDARYPAGALLVEEVTGVESLHFVVEGRGTLEHQGRPWRSFAAPDTLGLNSLLAGRRDARRARAETTVRTLQVGATAFLDLLDDDFGFLLRVLNHAGAATLRTSQGIRLADVWDGTLADDAPRAPDLVAQIRTLRSNALLRRAHVDALAGLCRQLTLDHLVAGRPLWQSGASPDEVACVLSGRLSVVSAGRKLADAGPGAILGACEALAGEPRAHDVHAQAPTLVLRGWADSILDAMEDHHELARAALAACAEKVLEAR
jgi:CRP-like cAMP-binding protein